MRIHRKRDDKANRAQESFNYILNDYNVLWAYYNKLLDERQKIFDNYIKIIGIPLTIIAAVISVRSVDEIGRSTIALMAALMGSVLILGHLHMHIFICETINAGKYYTAICKIQKYMKESFIDNQFNDIVFVLQENSKNGKRDTIKLCKVLIIAVINAIVVGIFLMLIILIKKDLCDIYSYCHIIFGSIIDLVLQIAAFKHLKKSY